MKKILLLIALTITTISYSRTVEVDVHGMTCAFCVDSLEKKFNKLEEVYKIEVSLKNNKIRLETNDAKPTLEVIKQTVLDAGFTPIAVKIIDAK